MKNTETFLRNFSNAWANMDMETILDAVTDDFSFAMANCDEGVVGKAAFANWLKIWTAATAIKRRLSIVTSYLMVPAQHLPETWKLLLKVKPSAFLFVTCMN